MGVGGAAARSNFMPDAHNIGQYMASQCGPLYRWAARCWPDLPVNYRLLRLSLSSYSISKKEASCLKVIIVTMMRFCVTGTGTLTFLLRDALFSASPGSAIA